jgi:hypothetical protein
MKRLQNNAAFIPFNSFLCCFSKKRFFGPKNKMLVLRRLSKKLTLLLVE